MSGTKNIFLVYLALAALFIHAIFQQRIISTMRAEINSALSTRIKENKIERPKDISQNINSNNQNLISSNDKSYSGSFYLNNKSPPNLPSVRLSEAEEIKAAKVRTIYGGKNDALHLGGFTEIDKMGISTNLWNFMLGPLAIRSVVDVGCGRGHSANHFKKNGAKILCVEGSHDAVTQSLLSPEDIVEHDFSRGPWWPDETFDAVWSVEFLEHVARPYMNNYLPIFHKSALLFVTSSAWGGWHHVEVHEEWWWRARLAASGFIYSEELTNLVRETAKNDVSRENFQIRGEIEKYETEKFNAQHLWTRMLVFINPKVASLPQHHHLFGGNGCFNDIVDNRDGGKPCSGVDALPAEYQSVLDCYRTTKGLIDPGNWKGALWECKKNKNLK